MIRSGISLPRNTLAEWTPACDACLPDNGQHFHFVIWLTRKINVDTTYKSKNEKPANRIDSVLDLMGTIGYREGVVKGRFVIKR